MFKQKYTNAYVDNILQQTRRQIQRVDDVVDSQTHIMWQCKICANIWKATPTKVIKSNTGCKQCAYVANGSKKQKFNIDYIHTRLQTANLKIVCLDANVSRGREKAKWQCLECNHVWYNYPLNVLKTKIGCPTCKRERQQIRNVAKKKTHEEIDVIVEERGIQRMDDYISMNTKSKWKCLNCSFVWSTRANDLINKGSGCPSCAPVSYSRQAIRWLDQLAEQQQILIQHAENLGEHAIPGTRYKVDGFCKETNTVYEFYGDIYHGNPKIFHPTERCNPFTHKTAGELYLQTTKRENVLRSLGYNVISRWETET